MILKYLKFTVFSIFFFTLNLHSQVYINELLRSAGNNNINQYIELRGTPSSTLSAGTYLVFLQGFSNSSGNADMIFDLSGMSFGSNGFLVLLQSNNTYNPNSNANVITASGTSWGNLATGDTQINSSGSFSALLIESSIAPIVSTDYDSNNDAILDGDAASWTILDAISDANGFVADPRNLYGGKINFIASFAEANANTSGGTNIIYNYGGFDSYGEYYARVGNSTGSSSADWIMGHVSGILPNLIFDTTKITNNDFSNITINTLGSENYDNTLNTSESQFYNKILIYPNPTTNIININTNNMHIDFLRIYDLNGRKLNEVIFRKNENMEDCTVNLSNFDPGVFIIELIGDGFNQYKKIIKN